jgi:hypothetical protein
MSLLSSLATLQLWVILLYVIPTKSVLDLGISFRTIVFLSLSMALDNKAKLKKCRRLNPSMAESHNLKLTG